MDLNNKNKPGHISKVLMYLIYNVCENWIKYLDDDCFVDDIPLSRDIHFKSCYTFVYILSKKSLQYRSSVDLNLNWAVGGQDIVV